MAILLSHVTFVLCMSQNVHIGNTLDNVAKEIWLLFLNEGSFERSPFRSNPQFPCGYMTRL